MGYILPVSQYQYGQYHTRDLKKRNRPFYVERTYKAALESAYEDAKDKDTEENSTPSLTAHRRDEQQTQGVDMMVMNGCNGLAYQHPSMTRIADYKSLTQQVHSNRYRNSAVTDANKIGHSYNLQI
ncbi:hypothetical protein [Lentibacillus saliphilus]|uniref:hypothetical protein n=1 Tax=Lentibacillus saliphilus TaxID=2737028 RepID=UPI001C2F1FDB|nr:hypothetical protein [Lentibacillus saliphilus]